MQRCAGNADVERMLGLAYYAQGKNQQALDAFLSAIDASPDEESFYATLQVLPDNLIPQSRLNPISLKIQDAFIPLPNFRSGNNNFFAAAPVRPTWIRARAGWITALVRKTPFSGAGSRASSSTSVRSARDCRA